MSRSEPSDGDLYPSSPPDLTRLLEDHLSTSFPADVALDLVLNELVARAADATRASGAALAMFRGEEMVCRAATGLHAPDLGIPLSTRDGLSGACAQTRLPQLCNDAETDPRIDPDTLHRGIRSILVVPVFDGPDGDFGSESEPALAGLLEVLSPLPNAFSETSEILLEEFARDVPRVQRAADRRLEEAPPPEPHDHDDDLLKSFDSIRIVPAETHLAFRQSYETWTVVLSGLVICAAIAVSFLVGSRVGWLGRAPARVVVAADQTSQLPDLAVAEKSAPAPGTTPQKTKAKASAKTAASTDKPSEASAGELIVYDKGKVIFRLKEPQAGHTETSSARASAAAVSVASPVIPASSKTRIASPQTVWLAPQEAEDRLLSRVEPKYPPSALAARRSGSVVLEVNVAEDGTVSSVRPLIGDPVLAKAAAEAVRAWRYQPYRANEQPAPFQTDVALTFSLPN